MMRSFRLCLVLLVAAAAFAPLAGAADKPDNAALERTRKQVKMLDDLYKTAVVLITEHYITKDSKVPAGTAAIALFDAMKKKGWHDVRLLDATGEPYNDANSPRDDFEKEAIKQLKAGKGGYEQVVQKDGKSYLRSATPIPVVLDKCVDCHPHYKDYGKDKPIGSLSYTLLIE